MQREGMCGVMTTERAEELRAILETGKRPAVIAAGAELIAEITRKRRASGKRAAFIPPSVGECREEALARGLPMPEGDAFFDRHTAGGWTVGRVKMVDWKAAFGTWEKNYRKWNPLGAGKQRSTIGGAYGIG